ncbi:tyrosine-type recombinase/integrase [Olleya namhaensis]|uniref:tyrosine-type recombinase/integrase n=1 Tax=Olleya namhaensis TaxID=1144750 RepID=UPI00248F9CEA|nr:phage integrase SAM-like domain-containing protein [Olleya namhaensis]
MATAKFEVLSNSINAPIYLRLSIKRGSTPRAKTGLIINSKDWSKDTKLPKQNTGVNKNLKTDLIKLQAYILEQYNKAYQNNITTDKQWLEHYIDVYFNRIDENKTQTKVTYWIEHIIKNAHLMDNSKGNYGLSKNRIKSYNSLLNRFIDYQSNKTINIKELDKKGFNAFKKWLFEDRAYSPSTATKFLTDLQKVVKVASEFTPIAENFNSIKFKKVKTYDDDMNVITLTELELQKIQSLKLESEALINARKWLILACYTGQRGEALLTRIKDENFIKHGKDYIIKIKQKKVNQTITIPVAPQVKEIYLSGLPYKISIQKLNTHIKTICKNAEITDLVMGKKRNKDTNRNEKKLRPKYKYISSHTGRRTFATLHYSKIPTPLIMKVTGHKKESTFLEYINQDQDNHVDILLEYYRTKELKERKESVLNVVKKAN